jgi:hypothetical protein
METWAEIGNTTKMGTVDIGRMSPGYSVLEDNGDL